MKMLSLVVNWIEIRVERMRNSCVVKIRLQFVTSKYVITNFHEIIIFLIDWQIIMSRMILVPNENSHWIDDNNHLI